MNKILELKIQVNDMLLINSLQDIEGAEEQNSGGGVDQTYFVQHNQMSP